MSVEEHIYEKVIYSTHYSEILENDASKNIASFVVEILIDNVIKTADAHGKAINNIVEHKNATTDSNEDLIYSTIYDCVVIPDSMYSFVEDRTPSKVPTNDFLTTVCGNDPSPRIVKVREWLAAHTFEFNVDPPRRRSGCGNCFKKMFRRKFI